MPKINYTNKQVAQDAANPVAPIEIFSARDANEIKESVNALYEIVGDDGFIYITPEDSTLFI
ncbi:hypothetical protein [Pedobacter sp. N23S346]|uniref:hypothetical protein n=1 Tax=Pedobacter sp. N23S346 TaxID=3402750 RepID=UPI003AC6F494